MTRNWFFEPTPERWRAPCAAGVVAGNCSQPPAWNRASFRRVRRLEAATLAPFNLEPEFTALKLGPCAKDMGLPRDGSAEWRQMWLGPGLGSGGCWGCPYLDECIAIQTCDAGAGSPVGILIPRGATDVGSPGKECGGKTLDWTLNGTAFISSQSGLCMEAKQAAAGSGLVQARCDAANPRQRWSLDPSSMQLRLGESGQCLEIPRLPEHDGHPDRKLGVYGLPSGDETPTNCVDQCGTWENQTTILEADAVDNATFHNHSPPNNPGNGAPIDFYGGVVWPRIDGDAGAGGVVYWLLPMRFTHYMLPCDGPDGTQCLPATFDIPVLASRDGLNFSYVADDRGALVEPAPSGGWNANGLTYVLGTPHLTDAGDEVVLYFWGINSNHNSVLDPGANETRTAIASARMRLDGFVHIEPQASTEPAMVVTRPLVFSGQSLVLNADAGGSGQLVVSLLPLGAGAKSVTSLPFSRNDVNGTMAWEDAGAVRKLEGVPLRLRFELRRCRLYSFQFV